MYLYIVHSLSFRICIKLKSCSTAGLIFLNASWCRPASTTWLPFLVYAHLIAERSKRPAPSLCRCHSRLWLPLFSTRIHSAFARFRTAKEDSRKKAFKSWKKTLLPSRSRARVSRNTRTRELRNKVHSPICGTLNYSEDKSWLTRTSGATVMVYKRKKRQRWNVCRAIFRFYRERTTDTVCCLNK